MSAKQNHPVSRFTGVNPAAAMPYKHQDLVVIGRRQMVAVTLPPEAMRFRKQFRTQVAGAKTGVLRSALRLDSHIDRNYFIDNTTPRFVPQRFRQ